jgi:hypothetical protein
MAKKHLWVNVVVGVVCAVVFFFIGSAYGKSSVPSLGSRGAFASSTRAGFAGRNGAGGGFVSGQIASIDASSITVSLSNGSSENVYYSSSTSIVKPTPGSASDLQVGTMVMIGGTSNSDGSVTASTIQIRNGSSTPGGR